MSLKRLSYTPEEKQIIAGHSTPEQIQTFIDTIHYNHDAEEKGVFSLRTFRRVVRDNIAHCFEGALSAAALMRAHGRRPRILCMDASDIPHMVCVFTRNKMWGAIGQSRDAELKWRDPKFKTIRDLVMSYYPHYWNCNTGDRNDLTLRGYTLQDLSVLDRNWITSEEDVWFVEDIFFDAEYEALFPEPGKTVFKTIRDESDIVWVR